jgi:hypothetical protein
MNSAHFLNKTGIQYFLVETQYKIIIIYLNYLLIINNKHFFNLSLNRANFEEFKKKIISKISLLEKKFSNGNIKHHKSYAGLNAVNNYNNFDSFCP